MIRKFPAGAQGTCSSIVQAMQEAIQVMVNRHIVPPEYGGEYVLQSAMLFETIADRPSSHCACITEAPDGDMLCVWYAGSREAAPDVALMLGRWRRATGQWDEPQLLLDTPGKPDGNAVLHCDPSGKLWLFHNVIEGRGWSDTRLYVRTSEDEGATWTDAEFFDPEVGRMVRTGMRVLSDGRWLLPAYDERSWRGLCYTSDDEGATWQCSEPMVAPVPLIQPAIVERSDGSLLAYQRTGGDERRIWASASQDRGHTWSECTATDLHNPNSGVDMVRLREGDLALVCNNVPKGRTPLHVAWSPDEGASWPIIRELESISGEFSYPTMLQARDGLVHIVYTYQRETIKHVWFDRAWLTGEA